MSEAVVGICVPYERRGETPPIEELLDQNFDVLRHASALTIPSGDGVIADVLRSAALVTGDVRCAKLDSRFEVLAQEGQPMAPADVQQPWHRAAVIELMPRVPIAPDCSEFYRHRDHVITQVNKLVAPLDSQLVAAFGAGHWFAGEVCPTSDVDLVIVTQLTEARSRSRSIQLLDEQGRASAEALSAVIGRLVSVRHIDISQLSQATFSPSELLPEWVVASAFRRQLPEWQLLLGGHPTSFLPAQSSDLAAELSWSRKTFGWLASETRSGRIAVADAVKHYLFHRLLADHARGHEYTSSFEQLRRRVSADRDDFVHLACAIRMSSPWLGRESALDGLEQIESELAVTA